MLLTFLPAALAFGAADADADTGGCRGTRLSDFRPVNGTVDMPADGLIRLAFQLDGCSRDSASVNVESDQDESWGDDLAVDPETGLVSWQPEGGWSVGRTYTVSVIDDANDEDDPRTFSFTVGADPADTIAFPPAVSIHDAWADQTDEDHAALDVELHVSSQPDPLGLTLVQLFDADDPDTILATKFGTGTGELEVAVAYDGLVDSGTTCLVAWQVDATGAASELGDPACAEIQWRIDTARPACAGCSSGLGMAGAGLAWCMVACLIAVRRERAL